MIRQPEQNLAILAFLGICPPAIGEGWRAWSQPGSRLLKQTSANLGFVDGIGRSQAVQEIW